MRNYAYIQSSTVRQPAALVVLYYTHKIITDVNIFADHKTIYYSVLEKGYKLTNLHVTIQCIQNIFVN